MELLDELGCMCVLALDKYSETLLNIINGSKNTEVIKMHTYKINDKQYFSINPQSKKKSD